MLLIILGICITSQVATALPLEANCKKSIIELPQCIFGSLEHCFEDNGCKISLKLPGGHGVQSSRNATISSCLSDIQTRVMNPFEKCMSKEIPNGQFTRLGNLFNSMQSLGSLPKNPLEILKKIIDLSCGQKADQVYSCVKTAGEAIPSEAFSCYGRISASCQNELLKMACQCTEEVFHSDPKVIDDTITCLKGMGILPPLAEALLSPQLVISQIDSRCKGKN